MRMTKDLSRHGLAATALGICWSLLVPVDVGSAQNWFQTMAPATNWQCIASSADGAILAAAAAHSISGTANGAIYISTDSGANWSPTGLPATNFYNGVAMSADGIKLAALFMGNGSQNAGLYYSADSGSNWTLRSMTFPIHVGGLSHPIACSADGSKLLVAGTSVFSSADAGVTWTTNNVPTTNWASVACSADGNTFAAVALFGSAVFVLTNSATAWSSNNLAAGSLIDVAVSADGRRMVALGNPQIPGPIYTSSDFGSTWVSNSAPKTSWKSVVSSADGTYLTAGAFSISIVTNGGTLWKTNITPSEPIQSMAASADGARVAVAVGTSGLPGGIYILQSVRPPSLSITATTSALNLSWTVPSTDFVLQQSVGLPATNWSALPAVPSLNSVTLQNQVTLPPPNASAFFRLATP